MKQKKVKKHKVNLFNCDTHDRSFFLDSHMFTNTDMALSNDASSIIKCGAVFGDELCAHKWSDTLSRLKMARRHQYRSECLFS